MKIIIPILLSTIVFCEKEYFQQDVVYDINVQLDDENHTLSAYEKITYTNNSPDTLQFIWFHLWPNAYKNTETAFAKQKERFLSTSFIFSDENKRGYIDSLNFMVNGIKDSTYSIRNAFDTWEQGFKDTKAGIIDADLELKFSRRVYDNDTAHETGIFHYYTIKESGERTDSFIHFEALWIKKQNKWIMLMENQISRASKSEWDSFNSSQ